MPNFLLFEQKPGLRQDGMREKEGIRVEELTKEQAEEFAEMMKQEFIKHWESKQSNKT